MKLLSLAILMVFLMSPAMTMFYLWTINGQVFTPIQAAIAFVLFVWAWGIKIV